MRKVAILGIGQTVVGEQWDKSLREIGGEAGLAAMDYLLVNGTPGYLVSAVTGVGQYGLDTHFPTVGNWMVVVPEPSSYALLLVAGALMMVLPRRR